MNKFAIGTTDFGIGKIEFKIDKSKSIISELVIKGSQIIFDKITEDKDGEWCWALNPPELYFREVPYRFDNNIIKIMVDENFISEYEVGLCFMEHNDFIGEVSVANDTNIKINGTVSFMGNEMDLVIEVNLLDYQ